MLRVPLHLLEISSNQIKKHGNINDKDLMEWADAVPNSLHCELVTLKSGQGARSTASLLGWGGRCAPFDLYPAYVWMHCSFPRPVFGAHCQAFANRVLHQVVPLLGIFLTRADAVVKTTALPFPFRIFVLFAETIFPVGKPFLDAEAQVMWGAKEMQVVRHQDIVTDHPSFGLLLPDFMQ